MNPITIKTLQSDLDELSTAMLNLRDKCNEFVINKDLYSNESELRSVNIHFEALAKSSNALAKAFLYLSNKSEEAANQRRFQ